MIIRNYTTTTLVDSVEKNVWVTLLALQNVLVCCLITQKGHCHAWTCWITFSMHFLQTQHACFLQWDCTESESESKLQWWLHWPALGKQPECRHLLLVLEDCIFSHAIFYILQRISNNWWDNCKMLISCWVLQKPYDSVIDCEGCPGCSCLAEWLAVRFSLDFPLREQRPWLTALRAGRVEGEQERGGSGHWRQEHLFGFWFGKDTTTCA